MADMNIDTFLRALGQSNLLPEELLSRVKKRVAEGNPNIDPRSVAKWLIDKQYLTLWQANKLLAGRTAFFLGRYKLLDRIGQGGMGVVFKARHAVMDRVVALKVMSHELLDKPHAVARFNREVKTAAALNHPNIITAHDADCVGRTHFLVMEYADGYDLNQWLMAKGPFPIAAACEFAMQAAVGLGHAFRQGMVHRDIKPVNLLLTWNAEADWPVVKILDLGLARFVSETKEDGGLTRVGQTIGTPDYIAPEAAENFKQADIRADLFSLGCGLFKLLTGRLPYGGSNTMEKLLARATKPAPLIRTMRPDVPEPLEEIIAKLLATSPADRFQTPAELAAALAPFAASTLNDRAAVEMFRNPPMAKKPTAEAIEADADTTLEEFFRDFAVAPLREEGAPPPPPARPPRSDDGDLELAPLDDDPPDRRPIVPLDPPKPAAAAVSASAAATGKSAKAEPSRKSSSATSSGAKSAKSSSQKAAGAEHDLLAELEPAGAPGGKSPGLPADAGKAIRHVRPNTKVDKSVWESPLLLISGSALLLLLFAGAALLWATNRQGSEARLKQANETYRAANYPQALREYNTFIEEFPHDDQTSFARVRRGLIQIRQAAESKGDWHAAFETADRVLREVSAEEKFRDVQEELASLLPTIAEGLATQAGKKHEPSLIKEAQATLELVNRYVPKSLRSEQRLQGISQALDVTTRQLARDQSLAEVVQKMQQAAASKDTAAAYQARAALLKIYPDLAADEKLQAATLGVSQAERARVASISELPKSEPAEPQSAIVAAVSFATNRVTRPVKVDSPVVFGLIGGATCGVDSSTGRLLWRRHLGFDVDWLPLAVSPQADSDLILTDAGRREAVRVKRSTGELTWRTSLADIPVAAGCLVGKQVVVPCASGRMTWMDLETGAATAALQLPQSISVATATDRRQKHLYQLADHSNLFVLAASGRECEEVFYLGHDVGAIRVPPVSASRYLFVFQNNHVDNATLQVLLTDEQGLAIKLIQELPLEGHVHETPIVEDRSLYVVTDRGAMYLFEIGTPDKPAPLAQLIALPPTSTGHTPHRFAVKGDKLWVGAEQLTSYTIQAARGRFTPDWVKLQKETCAQPLQTAGGMLFYGRIRPGATGLAFSCVDATGSRSWDAMLGSPLAGGPLVAANRAWAMTASGSLFAASEVRQPGATVSKEAAATLESSVDLETNDPPVQLAQSKAVFAMPAGAPHLPLADLASASPTLSWLKLPDTFVGGASSFSGGVLVPGRGGQVALLDATTGRPRVAPFQPSQRGGEQFAWSAPAVIDDRQFVISDGRTKLYRVEIQEQPKPHLAATAEVDLPLPITSSIAVLGEQVCGATTDGKLLRFRLPNLEPLEPLPLEGHVTLGPVRVGEQLLIATDRDQLTCLDAVGKSRWTVTLAHGPLAGTPLAVEGAIVCAAQGGKVYRVEPQTGAELGVVELGQPLAAGPVADNERLLLSTIDGTVLVISPP